MTPFPNYSRPAFAPAGIVADPRPAASVVADRAAGPDESVLGTIRRQRSSTANYPDFVGDLPVDPSPRAGERTRELVGEFMDLFECHLGAQPVGDLSGIKESVVGDMKRAQPYRSWDTIVRNINAYCRGLASAVAEFARSNPGMEPQARAVGTRLAQEARPLLAAGLFVPPPLFYRIAAEARSYALHAGEARGKHAQPQPQPQAQASDLAAAMALRAGQAAEAARWIAGMDVFYAENVKGVLQKNVAEDMDSFALDGIVAVEGENALQRALDYLPPGIEVPDLVDVGLRMVEVGTTVQYPGLAHGYRVVVDGTWRNLEIRIAGEGGCDYRLDKGGWIACTRSVTAAQRRNQTERLDLEINRVRMPPIDF